MANTTGNSPFRSASKRGFLNFSRPMQAGNEWFLEEPDLTEERIQIWKSQVLIHHSESKYT